MVLKQQLGNNITGFQIYQNLALKIQKAKNKQLGSAVETLSCKPATKAQQIAKRQGPVPLNIRKRA